MAKCVRCRRNPGVHSWTVDPCAAPSAIKAKLCDDCDVEVNEYILSFFRVRNKTKLIQAYREKVFGGNHEDHEHPPASPAR